LVSLQGFASESDSAAAASLAKLQQRWAEINYTLPPGEQAAAFSYLGDEADQLVERYPDAAELHIWAGIIRSTEAGASGGLGALGLVKQAKKELETALELNPLALDGSAYTSLGALYYQVPGWPLGFGDEQKAEWHLQRALAINPEGIDSLYFWGDYLHEQGRDAEARQALERALMAAPRSGRELADSGRRDDIRQLMSELQ
jgi:tetratricopeptide (TPR) repeat protein